MVNMARKSLSEELKEKTSSASTKAKWPDTSFWDILDGMQLPDIRNAIITSSRRMGKSMTVMDEMMPMFHSQSMGRSMRPMKNPASEIYIDSIPSIMPWHCFRSENKKSLDHADLFKSLDR